MGRISPTAIVLSAAAALLTTIPASAQQVPFSTLITTPLTIEGRFEFIRPGATEPTAVVTIGRNWLLTEPVFTGLFSAKLPDPALLPSGRYLVRAIIDYGVDHYIGTEREMNIERGAPVAGKK